jgi:hypothetical protein
MVRRPTILALAAFVAGTGCHAGLSGNTAKQEPPIPRETVTVKRFIDQHNKNASAVKSLSAQPRIEALADGSRHRVNGLMDMERPRGFRLNIRSSGMGAQVADIGSNEQEFWFWVKDNKDKAVYFCDYKDVNSSQLAVTYQPDWIIEALGLREIDPREAATIAASKLSDKPGLLVLTQARRDNHGQMITKETIVDEATGHIKEHRLWAGAKKDLLAKATVDHYARHILKETDANPSGSQIDLPEKFRLEWVAEKFALDVTMDKVKVNPQFPKEMREAKFTEPSFPGTNRINLARLGGPQANESNVYETMPSPRSGVRLGQPEPMEVEGGLRPRSEPQPLSADLPSTPAQPAGVVGAPIPRGSDPEALQASATRSSWRPRPAILDR